MAEVVADKATVVNACEDPRVRYDTDVRLTANGKPIPKGLTPWVKGQSGNPGGRPKGFIGAARAYQLVSQLSFRETERLAKGNFPVGWPHPKVMAFCRAAAELLSAGKRGQPAEINNRIDGPVANVIDFNIEAGGPLAILAQLAPPAAARRLEPAIDTPALPDSEGESV